MNKFNSRKNAKLLAMFLSTLLVGGCDGLSPDPTDPSNKALIDADHEYEIDTWGSNSEVYEFTPRSNENKTCVFVMLDSGSPIGLQCFDKPQSN